MNPKAGFLFPDFKSGDQVYATSKVEIVWTGAEVRAFAGAERLIKFVAEEVIRIERSLRHSFRFMGYSPTLEHTGNWADAAETIAADRERDTYIDYEVFDVQAESQSITSFYLRHADGRALAPYRPGHFLPVRLTIPGMEEPVRRTYTVSDVPDSGYYRLSIKREGESALVSNYLHDNAVPGFRIEPMAPRGNFVLEKSNKRPVVLISGGVGITPMIAMVNHIVREGQRTRDFRHAYFVHGARNGRELAFGDHVRRLAGRYENISVHIRLSESDPADRLGETHDSEGFIDTNLLKNILHFDDHEFYLCGPGPFMLSLFDGLIGMGVREERIHYESFGPATVLKRTAEDTPSPAPRAVADGPITVRFAKSGVEAQWSPDKGTLLELAQATGLSPDFSCRTGICGTCATKLTCGADYRGRQLGRTRTMKCQSAARRRVRKPAFMVAARITGPSSTFEQDKDWKHDKEIRHHYPRRRQCGLRRLLCRERSGIIDRLCRGLGLARTGAVRPRKF